MSVKESQLNTVTQFPGITNLGEQTAQKLGVLREAVNVDVLKEQKPRIRHGRTEALALAGCHSLWSHDNLPFALFSAGGKIMAFFPDYSTQDVVDPVAANRLTSYCLINDRIYWTNNAESGMITLGLESLEWGLDGPDSTPVCDADAAGGLDEGIYQIVCTFKDTLGRESGCGIAQPTQVEAGGGVMLSDIPQPADPVSVPIIRIYVTGANGDVLYRHADIPAGVTEYLVGKRAHGPKLETQLLVKMPPGHIVANLNGRQLVARGKELLFSPALRYGLVNPVHGRIGFDSRLALVAPVGDSADGAGVFVAAGARTYFIQAADIAQGSQRIAYPYGVVPGTCVYVPGNVVGLESPIPVPVWLAKNGQYCVGVPGGGILALKTKDAVTDIGTRGASLFREYGGHRHIITSLKDATSPALRLGDRVVTKTYSHTTPVQ